ncbi:MULTISPECIES: hypothetical protein [unclassified Pseudonocardia]|uniref:hypothetical protein n=1 Tax=unclassified Pseudonocardia TaxID=2619320 RepID=UPI0001FFE0C8|nr:hypothetical protein [Pseudonocardia sp. Ae707_Ps1]OLM19421.1 hypothetical protein Ae707Ps1_3680 [Pseudonocardia sp. Ae707_Ps1]
MSETTQPPSTESFVTGYVAPTIPPQNSWPDEPVAPAAPVRPRRWPLLFGGMALGGVIATVPAVIVALALAPTGTPAAGPTASAPTVSASSPTGGGGTPVASAPAAQGEVGDQLTDVGITLTVTSAEFVPNVMVSDNAGSASATYAPQGPGDDARYFAVRTHVVNDGQKSIDLTCSSPITNALIDDRGRKFDAFDGLYKIQGNPYCNDAVQPGFEADMTYVYRVPSSATITSWSFADAADPTSFSRPGTIVQVG